MSKSDKQMVWIVNIDESWNPERAWLLPDFQSKQSKDEVLIFYI
jgi:hypothetical protein